MNPESMKTTRDDLRRWFDEGVAQGATYLVVATDSFDYEDYPIYVRAEQDVSAIVNERQDDELSLVMEVYDLSADRDQQIDAQRTWAIESPEPVLLNPLLPKLFPDIAAQLAVEFLRKPRRRS